MHGLPWQLSAGQEVRGTAAHAGPAGGQEGVAQWGESLEGQGRRIAGAGTWPGTAVGTPAHSGEGQAGSQQGRRRTAIALGQPL